MSHEKRNAQSHFNEAKTHIPQLSHGDQAAMLLMMMITEIRIYCFVTWARI